MEEVLCRGGTGHLGEVDQRRGRYAVFMTTDLRLTRESIDTVRQQEHTGHQTIRIRQKGKTLMTMTTQPAASAPPPLATPSDLGGEGVQAIAEALNPVIADSFALYVKTKNFHWHLFGSHFRDFHLLFDEQAEQILASIDDLAERVRKIGDTTIRSISHIAQLQSIQDNNAEPVPPDEMVRELCDDNVQMVKGSAPPMRSATDTGMSRRPASWKPSSMDLSDAPGSWTKYSRALPMANSRICDKEV